MGTSTHLSSLAWVAQLVEHSPEEGRVGGSSPPPSTSMNRFKRLLLWADRNERHLGAVFFVFGFITDILTFGTLDIQYVNFLFIGYLAVTAIATLISHYLYSHESETDGTLKKSCKVIFPLLAQYAIGSLLSGTLIFYTKSSTFFVSWPFLILLALIFIGNEFFRTYKHRLTFQAVQLFFTLYAYILFALPLELHTLGRSTFLISTAVSSAGFIFFLILLYLVGKTRFIESFFEIVVSSLILVLAVIGSYFTGILPPLPLTLKDAGVYHSLQHTGTDYIVTTEQQQTWYESLFNQETVHLVPGDSLYGYSSVFAPGAFQTDIVHVWERYVPEKKTWVLASRIPFSLSGGRNGGYRGYSEISSPEPGEWRLSVLSSSNQVIGRVHFTVASTNEPVGVITLTK